MHLVIAFLIVLLIVCVLAALVAWILTNIPGVPAWAPKVVWAVAGIIVLIWLLQNMTAIEHLALIV
jgi:hypothetical protein